MQSLAPIITVPRRFWDREYGEYPLPKAVNVTFEVAGQQVDDVSAHGFVSLAEDSELRLSGLWAVSHDRFPGHFVVGWLNVGEDTIRLQLQPPESADEQHPTIDRKRQAPADLPEPQAKVQALSARQAIEWDSSRDPGAHLALMEWRPEGLDVPRLTVDPHPRMMPPGLLPPASRLTPRRGGNGGRMRGGSRATPTGRGCAKLVRTTTRLYIGVGQVREWLGEVGARTELQVKVMLDNRMLFGNHQADLLYNKGAHYYWITSRTLKRTAMGKWFLGWSHTPGDGLVLLLRSPSKDEIAAAIAEGFQGKDDEEDADPQDAVAAAQQQAAAAAAAAQMQQQMLLALSPPSPRPGRVGGPAAPQPVRAMAGVVGLPGMGYQDDDAGLMMQPPPPLQQQTPGSGLDDMAEAGPGQYHRRTPVGAGGRGPGRGPALGGENDDDAVSGLSGDSELRRALGPSDPRLMMALAAAELQRGMYGGVGTPGGGGGRAPRRPTPGLMSDPRGYGPVRDPLDTPPAGRGQAGMGLGPPPSAGAMQYREPLSRAASEGMGAATGAGAAGGLPRSSSAQPGRLTNFSEVPGGTAFANVTLPAEGLAADAPLHPPLPQAQPQRGGGPLGGPSQLGTATSIASNLSLPGPGPGGQPQMPGSNNASALQASGVAGPVGAPLRIPTVVSDLLPPEYLPAAVSVRHAVNNKMVNEIVGCEIHRSRQGHCYLYNFPSAALEGRTIEDWLISEDGCLVLLLKQGSPPPPPQPQPLAETKSVRSNPSQSQSVLVGGPSVNPDAGVPRGSGRVPGPGPEAAGVGRPQRLDSDTDLETAAAEPPPPPQPVPPPPAAATPPAGKASPIGRDQAEDLMQSQDPPADAVAFTTLVPPPPAAAAAPEPQPVVAQLPVLPEVKVEDGAQRERPLVISWQSLEALYGVVGFPFPVLVRFQINGELQPQIYLSEVQDSRTGRLAIVGVPSELHAGRAILSWRRMMVLSHSVLVCSVQDPPDTGVQGGKAHGGQTAVRAGGREEEPRKPRPGDAPAAQQPGGPQFHGQQHPHPQRQHQQQQSPQLQSATRPDDEPPDRSLADPPVGGGGARHHAAGSPSNPFAVQPALTGLSQQREPATHPHQPGAGAGRGQHEPSQRRPSGENSAAPGGPQQPLQPALSGPLPVVGSSKLPAALSFLNNTGSNLLPAQASNLPGANSTRPEGMGSVIIGGVGGGAAGGGSGGGRPGNASGRGGAGVGASAAGGAAGGGGQRATGQPLDVESHGDGMLATVASVASLSRPPGLGPAPSVAYGWAQEGGASAVGYGSEVGGGQEPPSPQGGGVELPPQSTKRPAVAQQQHHHHHHHHQQQHQQHHYQQQQHHQQQHRQQHPQQSGAAGRAGGGGGSGPHSGSHDAGALMPRSTVHTADFSANAGSQAAAAQQQPSLLQTALVRQQQQQQQQREGVDQDVRRSPASGGSVIALGTTESGQGQGGGPGGGSGRGRWQQQPGPGPDAVAQGVAAAGGTEGPPQGLRFPQGHGRSAYRSGSGTFPADSGAAQEPPPPARQQQQQPRGETTHYHHHNVSSWRFDPGQQPELGSQLQPQQPRSGEQAQGPQTSFPGGGGGSRRGAAAAAPSQSQAAEQASSDPGHGHGHGPAPDSYQQTRYEEDPYPGATSRLPSRPTTDEMDARMEEAGRPQGAPRAADDGRDQPTAGAGDAADRQVGGYRGGRGYEGGGPDNDVEMEDAAPGTAAVSSMPTGAEAASRPHLMDAAAAAADRDGSGGPGGRGREAGEDRPAAAAGQQPGQGSQQQPWQRRGDAGSGPAHTAQEQGLAAGRAAAALVAAAHPGQQWFPRLDLTGTTASVQEREVAGAVEAAAAPLGGSTSRDEQGGQHHHHHHRPSDEGEAMSGERPPPRRPGVLRMLSAVVREPEEGEIQE